MKKTNRLPQHPGSRLTDWAKVIFAIFLLGALFSPGVYASDLDIEISELNYHPVTSEDDEFIELYNTSTSTVNLSGWFFSEGVSFVFPDNTAIGPNDFVVIAKNAASIEALYGIKGVLGDYTGNLSNVGEKLTLRNADGQLVDRIAYTDGDPWPSNPDGLGPSLERTRFLTDGEQQWVWRASIPLGGTPGAMNSTIEERNSQVLIAQGHLWKYFKGTKEPSSPLGAWTASSFNDNAWSTGPSGFGYGDNDDATVLSDMRDNYSTVYIRTSFNITDPDLVASLVLSVTYDDGFVAYLNGSEIHRSNSAGGTAGNPLTYNATADGSHENDEGIDSVELAGSPLLVSGKNVLAIQVLNHSLGSGDLSMIPELSLTELSPTGYIEPDHDLEINEVFSGSSPSESYVEIFNESDSTEDLSGDRLVTDPTGLEGYTFPGGSTLAAGAFMVITGDMLPFELTNDTQWLALVTGDNAFIDGIRTMKRETGQSWGRWPDGDGDMFVLNEKTPGTPNTFTPDNRIVINEIRYHPPLANYTEEYIEIFNRSDSTVDLSRWELKKGVHYTFPEGASLASGAYLVVSEDPTAVQARYGISNVLGPWGGHLSNSDDKIELVDQSGNRVDVVHYADDGTWPASTDLSGPDGFGPSIELVNPDIENNHGSAWKATTGNGSPGRINSKAESDPAPVIRSPSHFPTEPLSSDTVTVTARVSDNQSVGSVKVYYRKDGTSTFSQLNMTPVGIPSLGRYSASLPAQNSGTIVQFYIRATDNNGHRRNYPSNAPTRTLLYQVDNNSYPSGLPLYRLIMRANDFQELTSRSVQSNILLDGTFIRGKDIFYNVGVRYRGEHSRNYSRKAFRVQLTHDQRFEGIKNLNLNIEDIYKSTLALDFMRRSDVPTPQSRVVAFTVNRNFNNAYGGFYERVEAVDRDFARRAFQGDDGGNLYRGLDLGGGNLANLSYRGSDPADYEDIYEKKTNREENDYSDIIELTNAFANTPDADFFATMSNLLDLDEWLRYFAEQAVISNQDGCIATGGGEDYRLYHRPADGRWVIIPWDQNEAFSHPGEGLFKMASAIQRLFHHPQIVRSYFQAVQNLLEGPLAETNMTPRIDDLRDFFSKSHLDGVSNFVSEQQQAMGGLFTQGLTVELKPDYFVHNGDTWRFFRGKHEPSSGSTLWTQRSFNDSSWEEGPGGFGYGDGDDNTILSDMRNNYTTVYIRHRFTLDNPGSINGLTLSIRYDDGFVAYLNGTEIARRNVTGTVRYDERASDHEAGNTPTIIDVSSFASRLVSGTNVIAAVGVNGSSGSSDLTLDPELYTSQQGSGCGSRLFSSGDNISIGGTAPILSTAAVEVNGEAVSYNSEQGQWYSDNLVIDPGGSQIIVRTLDENGLEVDSTSIEVYDTSTMTNVGGTLSTRTWSKADSPYLVESDITIASGSTLTVDPGVVVLFTGGQSLVVRGTLNAAGTTSEPIVFQANTCADTWEGLLFTGSSAGGSLQHCEITHAAGVNYSGQTYGGSLNCTGGAEVTLEECRLADSESMGIEAQGSSTRLNVLDTLIENCAGGIHCDSCFADLERVHIANLSEKNDCVTFVNESNTTSIIRDCILENGPADAIHLSGSSATIEGNLIAGMADKGIFLEGSCSPYISGVIITGCNTGLFFGDNVTATMDHCTISGNSVGLYGEGSGSISADSFIVWDNGYSIFLAGQPTLDLTFSDVQGGYPGTDNAVFDPLFTNPGNNDFHLQAGSPAAGTGKDGSDMGALPTGGPVRPVFLRGDANSDESIDISDAVGILLFLFNDSTVPCAKALDANDSGSLDISDAIYLLGYLFADGPQPPPPFPFRGIDPTEDQLSCGK